MVRDTGPGIPRDKLETVFQAFKQADGSTNRKYGGTGLGLSISRELAHCLGGTLELSSTAGRGSVFTLSLPETIDVKKDSDHAGPAALAHEPAGPRATADTAPADTTTGYLTKPVTMEAIGGVFARIERVLSKKIKKVLVVEDEKITQVLITKLIGNDRVRTVTAATGNEARKLLREEDFDIVILDLGLPDMSGKDLLIELRKEEKFHIPVIIHTAGDLTAEERAMLDGFAESIVIKDTKSREKLLDETLLFLHQVEADLPAKKREMLRMVHDREAILENKKILIVDDDMRNVFALINILEDNGMTTIAADNGKQSLERLKENPDTDLVLMDIMMPEMDGYTAMQEIRKMESEIGKVPVIALTAKAMKGDRAKCIQAGASDYLAKPVDTAKLLSMLRVWLY